MPAIPLGTTTILNATRIGPHASNASANDVRQRHRGSGGNGLAPGVASNRRYTNSRYRSYPKMLTATRIIPRPPAISRYFNVSIVPHLYFYFLQVSNRVPQTSPGFLGVLRGVSQRTLRVKGF